jgi:hypothetical protein
MGADIMEKEKGSLPAGQKKLRDHGVKTAVTLPVVVTLPALELEASYALQYRRLQEESEAREKKLLAEMEVKNDLFCIKLEESFAQREKLLIDDLNARHMAEYCRLEQVASDREQTLLNRLGVARRRLIMVILAAVVIIAAMWNLRIKPNDVPSPVLPSPVASGDTQSVGTLLSASAPVMKALPATVAKAVPAVATAAGGTVVKAGNGGNFAGGSSSVK